MMKKIKIECPICNDPIFHSVSYYNVESLIVHMMRDHNWGADKTCEYWNEQMEVKKLW